jgi:glutaconate CoA-transferase subunit A
MESARAWVDEWVFGVPDRAAYWQKLGSETHKRLQVKPRLAAPVNYGEY